MFATNHLLVTVRPSNISIMKFLVVIAALFVASISALPSGRIANGEQAALGEFPFFVSVYNNNSHVCGGFIYNLRWVITTASCVLGRPVNLFTVVAGQISLIDAEPTEQRDVVRTVITNSNYDAATGANDIALLQLRNDLVFNDVVYYAPYDEVNPNNPDAIFMGFGGIISANQPFSRLLKTTMQLNQDCSAYPGFTVNNMICAGSANASPCNFDEGGPLIQIGPNGPVAKGILSRQNNCTGPAVFTRLTPFYDFINNNAGQPYAPTPSPPTTTTTPGIITTDTTITVVP